MPDVVKAAILQTSWTGDNESMIKLHEKYVAEAVAAGTRVMCFQELSCGPYLYQVQDRPDMYGPLTEACVVS